MTDRDKLPCYYAFIKLDSPFAPLRNIFSDGIPVFEVLKTRFENSDQCHYSWTICLDKLSDIQKIKTLEFFSWISDSNIEELTNNPLILPDNALSMVLDSNLEEVNVKWAFLQQRTAHYLSTQNYQVNILLSAQQLHLIRMCFCSLIAHELLPNNIMTDINPFLEQIDNILTKDSPDLKTIYKCFSSPNITKAIDNLN